MSIPRFFMESNMPQGDVVTLPFSDKEAHHIVVRRIEPGEHIAACAAGGNCWEVEVVSVSNEGIVGRPLGKMPVEHLPNLTLVQGISKGDRMGQTIRQTTELGIQRIIPFLSERTVVRLAVDERGRKGSRWRRIALSAAKQSGRGIIPHIGELTTFKTADMSAYDLILVAYEDERQTSLKEVLRANMKAENIAVIIGPEGGLEIGEVESLINKGGKAVSLGRRILRTETAGMATVAMILYELEE